MKISIITATYNSAKTLENTIQSLINQKLSSSKVEYIVIDGDSKDDTVSIIQKYSEYISIWVSEKDSGIYDALNKGIRLATGDIIGFLHSDDIFANPTILEKIAQTFLKQQCQSVYGDLEYVSQSNTNKTIRYWKSNIYNRKYLRWAWMPPHPTFFVKREMYEQFGLFNSSLRISADYELILRLLWKNNISSVYIPEVLVKMRLGGESNRSLKNLIQKWKEDYFALQTNGVGGFFTVIWKNLRKIPQFLIRNSYESNS